MVWSKHLICCLIALLAFSQVDDYLALAFDSVAVTLVDNEDEYLPAHQDHASQTAFTLHVADQADQTNTVLNVDALSRRALASAVDSGPAGPPPLYVFMSLQI